jgi:hypothetical protein
MSIQKMERGAWMLVDKKFNIPLFNAEKQMYVCINVEETISAPAGKTYTISFSEVKGMGYNVPERVDVALYVPTIDANGELAHLNMIEVDPKRGNLPLAKIITNKKNISSLSGLKELFIKMAKAM